MIRTRSIANVLNLLSRLVVMVCCISFSLFFPNSAESSGKTRKRNIPSFEGNERTVFRLLLHPDHPESLNFSDFEHFIPPSSVTNFGDIVTSKPMVSDNAYYIGVKNIGIYPNIQMDDKEAFGISRDPLDTTSFQRESMFHLLTHSFKQQDLGRYWGWTRSRHQVHDIEAEIDPLVHLSQKKEGYLFRENDSQYQIYEGFPCRKLREYYYNQDKTKNWHNAQIVLKKKHLESILGLNAFHEYVTSAASESLDEIVEIDFHDFQYILSPDGELAVIDPGGWRLRIRDNLQEQQGSLKDFSFRLDKMIRWLEDIATFE